MKKDINYAFAMPLFIMWFLSMVILFPIVLFKWMFNDLSMSETYMEVTEWLE